MAIILYPLNSKFATKNDFFCRVQLQYVRLNTDIAGTFIENIILKEKLTNKKRVNEIDTGTYIKIPALGLLFCITAIWAFVY